MLKSRADLVGQYLALFVNGLTRVNTKSDPVGQCVLINWPITNFAVRDLPFHDKSHESQTTICPIDRGGAPMQEEIMHEPKMWTCPPDRALFSYHPSILGWLH